MLLQFAAGEAEAHDTRQGQQCHLKPVIVHQACDNWPIIACSRIPR
jgi:hypothetical protein